MEDNKISGSIENYLKQIEATISVMKDDEEPDIDEIDSAEKAVTELGDNAIPLLKTILNQHRKTIRGYYAAYYLAIVGGQEAKQILQAEYEATKDPAIKSALVLCMASTGTEEDVDFLIRTLLSDTFDKDWERVGDPETAALSLGVLRSKISLNALEKKSTNSEDQIAANTAREVIRWITSPDKVLNEEGLTSYEDQIVLAILKCGVPGIHRNNVFFEREKNRVWHFSNGVWSFKHAKDSPRDVPELSFEVYITQNGLNSLTSVSLHFGRLDATGYTYVLRKESGGWKVRGIKPTWIA